MSAPLVLLDRQHAGKRSRPGDMGAAADLDKDGRIETWEQEAHLTPLYAQACQRRLAAEGVATILHDPAGAGLQADYPERHRWAVATASRWAGPCLYGALHLNAGGGDYALVGHDPRSRGGRRAAEAIAAELEALPVISRARVVALEGPWLRGLGTIRGIYAGPSNLSGVLLEPLFLDHPEHQAFMRADGLVQVGEAIARGVLALWPRSPT